MLAPWKRLALSVFVLVAMVVSAEAQRFPRTLFVENGLGRTLSLVNLENGEVEENILSLGEIPNDMVAYRQHLYVVNSQPPEVMVIDPLTRQIVRRIALPEGSNPYQIALVGAHRAYVTLLVANEVAVVDLQSGSIEKRIPVGKGPQGIFIDLSSMRAYVANTGGYPDFRPASVSVIDVARDSVVMTLPLPDNAQSLRGGPDGKIYIVCSGKWGENAGKICVLDPWAPPNYEPAITDTVEIGGFPGDIVVTPKGLAVLSDWGDQANGFIYLYDIYGDSVLYSAAHPLRVGRGAMRLLYDAREDRVYISNFDQDTIQELDPAKGEVLFTAHVGDGPQAMAIVEPAELHDPWADEVVEFVPGDPWSGFGYLFFPDNVLGPPTSTGNVNAYSPANTADEILSLGHGGQITLAFTDNVVVNGEGPDFTVFENCFINLWTGEPFVEAGIVSVSQDGITWVTFPYDTLTYDGLAGAHPVRDPLDPTDPTVSGGDQFDLAAVGLPWIRFVRITDMGDLWQEGPYNGDFDLDAVVAVNSADEEPSSVTDDQRSNVAAIFSLLQNYPNPFNESTTLRFRLNRRAPVELEILDSNGRSVRRLIRQCLSPGEHRAIWDGRDDEGRLVVSGIYFARLRVEDRIQTRKMVLVK